MAYRELDVIFGSIVKNKRLQLGITQEKLAELAGISIVYCRDLEKGKSRSSWVIWLKLCVVLKIDINSIIENYIKPEINEIGEILGMMF